MVPQMLLSRGVQARQQGKRERLQTRGRCWREEEEEADSRKAPSPRLASPGRRCSPGPFPWRFAPCLDFFSPRPPGKGSGAPAAGWRGFPGRLPSRSEPRRWHRPLLSSTGASSACPVGGKQPRGIAAVASFPPSLPKHAPSPPALLPWLLGGAMAKIRVAYEYTEAEDKTIRLGLFLIVSALLSLFILGFCWLNPALQGLQGKAANCTVLSVQRISELFECTFRCGGECKGTSLYPCLQIYVNNSESNGRALLHPDEHQLLTNPKCSYIPPCERENEKNSDIVMHWQIYWEDEVGSQPFTCYFNQHLRPDDVLLQRTHDESVLLHCFLWPVVTFLVGVLIVVLTICAKSLAVKAETMKKRKHS